MNDKDFSLYFDGLKIGTACECFLSDGVYFGTFVPCAEEGYLCAAMRIEEYISFCRDWNQRAAADEADAAEFGRFKDITSDDRWTVQGSNDPTPIEIEGAPSFFDGDEVTFRTK